MTIFILDTDLQHSAQYLDDISLDKQIISIAWILTNTHYECYKNNFVKTKRIPLGFNRNKVRIPWTRWSSSRKPNYNLLVEYGLISCKEWDYRMPFIHSYKRFITWAQENVPELPRCNPNCGFTRCHKTCNPAQIPSIVPKRHLVSEYIRLTQEHPAVYTRSENHLTIPSYRHYFKASLKNRINKLTEGFSLKSTREMYLHGQYSKRKMPEWLDNA